MKSLILLSLIGLAMVGCAPTELSDTPTPASESSAKTEPAKTEPEAEKPAEPSSAPVPDKPKDGEEVAVVDTDKGKIILMFYPTKAPKHVAQFKKLAKTSFYDGVRFHRCIPGFMIQGGDPNSKDLSKSGVWGSGGYTENGKEVNVPAEFNDVKHVRGVLSAARSQDPNSASSQFFIMVADNPGLDGQYSAFGKVVSGQEVADEIVKTGDPNNNGSVEPKKAIVVKSIKIVTWPVK